jgi:hypothetical protein
MVVPGGNLHIRVTTGDLGGRGAQFSDLISEHEPRVTASLNGTIKKKKRVRDNPEI